MARFTVRLDDTELGGWVEQQAEDRERSKAWVIRQAVAAAAGRESVFTDAHRTDAHRTGADRTDTTELEDRLDALEAAVFDDNAAQDRDSPSGADDTPTPQAPESNASNPDSADMDEFRSELGGWLAENGPQTEHGRRGILRVVDELQARGPLKSEDLTNMLDDEIGENYSRRKSMWESVKRWLEDTPGVYKTDNYSEWAFAGVDEARGEF